MSSGGRTNTLSRGGMARLKGLSSPRVGMEIAKKLSNGNNGLPVLGTAFVPTAARH